MYFFACRPNKWSLFSCLCILQTLTDTLCTELGKDGVKLESKVLSLSYSYDGKSTFENWSVSYASKGGKHAQASSYDAVIMTVSSFLIEFFFFGGFV
jgi:oxygen-dependent protoporphyrinogen oxidase